MPEEGSPTDAERKKVHAVDLVAVLRVGTFKNVPWFGLSLPLGVVLDTKIQTY